jgi:hypothetical protein
MDGTAVSADGATVYATLKPAPGSLPRGQLPETLVETVPKLPALVSITVGQAACTLTLRAIEHPTLALAGAN